MYYLTTLGYSPLRFWIHETKIPFFDSIKKREPVINKREEDWVRPKIDSFWLASFVTFLTCWQYPKVLDEWVF